MTAAAFKRLCRSLHLYLGLVAGLVFVVLGLTGSALVWIEELDHAFNPQLFRAAPGTLPPDAARVNTLVDQLTALPGYGRPTQLVLPAEPGGVIVVWYRRPAGQARNAWALDVSRQVMIDPGSLRIVGERRWGELGWSRPLLMPTLFHLHRYLFAGDVGKTTVAVVGLSVVVLSLLGMVLWWPKPTWGALRSAVTVRFGGSWPRFNYTSHRAVGLFAAPVFVLLGVSGAYFNMPAWIAPVVNAVAPVTPLNKKLVTSGEGGVTPAAALTIAQNRFPQARLSRLGLPAKLTLPYEVRLRQPGERRHGDGATRVSIDAGTGRVLKVVDPLTLTGGDAFLGWMFPLHSGEAFGTAHRVFMTVAGLLPLGFFVTGLLLWLRRRRPAASKKRVVKRAVARDAETQKSNVKLASN